MNFIRAWVEGFIAFMTLLGVLYAAVVGVHLAGAVHTTETYRWNPIFLALGLILQAPPLPPHTFWWVLGIEAVYAALLGTLIANRNRLGGRAKTVDDIERVDEEGFVTLAKLMDHTQGTPGVTRLTAFARFAGEWISATSEDVALMVAPPRMGKTVRLVLGRVIAAAGAVVVTSTKPDVLRFTARIRMLQGSRVHVFDPDGVSKWRRPVKWDIVAGCEDEDEAACRAKAMIAARPLKGGGGNDGFFAAAAETVLKCLLHAAALDGGNMRDVVGWARDFDDDAPYDILRTHPDAAPGWVADLRKFCRAKAHETVESTDMSLRLMLTCLGSRRMLNAVCPEPGDDVLDAGNFWNTRDTLYLLCDSDVSLSAPVITALVSTIERTAKREATRFENNRLDPELTLILDEVANVAPIPSLPALMSDGGGRGILTWAIAQSRSQLIERWSKEEAKTIIDSVSILLVLGALKDTDFLDDISRLCAERTVQRESSTQSQSGFSTSVSTAKERVLTTGDLHQLPRGDALLLYRELAPAVVYLPGWWESERADEYRASTEWVMEQEGIIKAATPA